MSGGSIITRPILITGAGKRIGLKLAHYFLNTKQPVIISYRTRYSDIDQLEKLGVICIKANFSSDESILHFAGQIKKQTPSLRAIIHNASDWLAESHDIPLAETLNMMMKIHVSVPYLLNHALESLLCGHGVASSDIIHMTDYVVEKGSEKHIAYAASKAALDNMTRSFARKLSPEVKVNSIAPSMIMFNENDCPEYRNQSAKKALLEIAPGEQEIIRLVEYLLGSRYVTGRSHAVDGGRPLC